MISYGSGISYAGILDMAVVDSLSRIEDKASSVAKKIGTSVENVYDSIGFDSVDFLVNPLSKMFDYKDAEKYAMDLLDDEGSISKFSRLSDDNRAARRKRLNSRIKTGFVFGSIALAGAYGAYDGIDNILKLEDMATKNHPEEREVYDGLSVVSGNIGSAISYLDYDPPQNRCSVSPPSCTYVPADHPNPLPAKGELAKAVENYESISGKLPPDDTGIVDRIEELSDGLPDEETVSGNQFQDQIETLNGIMDEVNGIRTGFGDVLYHETGDDIRNYIVQTGVSIGAVPAAKLLAMKYKDKIKL